MFISLWIGCVTERERRGRQWRGGLSLPHSLSLSCGRNRHLETERVRFYGNASGGEAGEARWGGDLWSSELISKALYGTSTQTTESYFTPTAPLPSLLHHLKGDLLHLLPITDAHFKHDQCSCKCTPCESTAQTWDCSEHSQVFLRRRRGLQTQC